MKCSIFFTVFSTGDAIYSTTILSDVSTAGVTAVLCTRGNLTSFSSPPMTWQSFLKLPFFFPLLLCDRSVSGSGEEEEEEGWRRKAGGGGLRTAGELCWAGPYTQHSANFCNLHLRSKYPAHRVCSTSLLLWITKPGRRSRESKRYHLDYYIRKPGVLPGLAMGTWTWLFLLGQTVATILLVQSADEAIPRLTLQYGKCMG